MDELKPVPAAVELARRTGLIRPTLGAAALGKIPVGFALEIGGGAEVWTTVNGGMIADRDGADMQLTVYLNATELRRALDASPLRSEVLCVRCGLTVRPPQHPFKTRPGE